MTSKQKNHTAKALERYAALAKWYELHLEDISKSYPDERDYPGVIARQAIAARDEILNETTAT